MTNGTNLSRRKLMVGAAAAPVLLQLSAMPAAAQASGAGSANGSAGQVAAIRRLTAGGHVVTVLSDGYLELDTELLSDTDPEEVRSLLEAAFEGGTPFVAGLNVFLVQMPDRLVLIDTGGAGAFPNLGALQGRFAEIDVSPEDVTDVLMTHLHPDHVGGLVLDGELAFPNATVHVHQNEVDYWTSLENRDAAPESTQGFFDTARTAIETAGERVETFTGKTEVVPGITSREFFGHTPGHSGFMIGEGEDGLLVWGDIVHIAPVQLARPEIAIAFDSDPEAAVATRQAVLEEVAANRTRIAGMHIGFPGVGHIREASGDEAYGFVPAGWQYVID